ncbi:MAG: sugar phosphate isomerase/epimerase [Planctomycetaceae bacterium]|nr:sugar phosphate isomerase/epimerase [Planctomycetaceae bacterium]
MTRADQSARLNRRSMLLASSATVAAASVAALDPTPAGLLNEPFASEVAAGMKFGLVTYLWGKDMELPTLIDACEKSGLAGVELRTEHRHGVEPALSKAERREVQKRFEASPVELVGYGSNAQFHEADPDKVKANIELTKQYVQLMHDCGGSGVKVKPNGFPKDVSREQTIAQIGNALNEVAEYGQKYGQQIRVEVHGSGTSELPVMKAIFDVATHPNVAVCWNSNAEDLRGDGLEHNFNLVRHRLGATTHVRELTEGDYPYDKLFRLFKGVEYAGWILLEARTEPADKVAALIAQRQAFEKLVADAR